MHRGKAHAGEHEAIVDRELFDRVGALLAGNRADNDNAVHAQRPAPLTGILWDGEGRRMTPNHASKRGVRYRYYVSRRDKDRLHLPIWRAPAGDLESLVAQQIACHTQLVWTGPSPAREQILATVSRITIGSDAIEICLIGHEEPITVPAKLISRSGERRISTPQECWQIECKDPALIKLIVRAHQARKALAAPEMTSISAAAAQLGVSVPYFASLLRLGHLAPDITAAILDGRQPAHINRQHLAKLNNLPIDWAEQRQILRFSHAIL